MTMKKFLNFLYVKIDFVIFKIDLITLTNGMILILFKDFG